MPQIVRCEQMACRYNSGVACHAAGVAIGARREAVCESRSRGAVKTADPEIIGTVEICGMMRCVHNEESLCTAFSGVSLVSLGNEATCALFRRAEAPMVTAGKTRQRPDSEEHQRPARVVKTPLAS